MTLTQSNKRNNERVAAQLVECPFCKAAPGEKCFASFDVRTRFPHRDRVLAVDLTVQAIVNPKETV